MRKGKAQDHNREARVRIQILVSNPSDDEWLPPYYQTKTDKARGTHRKFSREKESVSEALIVSCTLLTAKNRRKNTNERQHEACETLHQSTCDSIMRHSC